MYIFLLPELLLLFECLLFEKFIRIIFITGVRDDEEPTVIDEYPDVQCRANFGRFPHEECNQFYQCDGGYARLFKCPDGKMFDSDSSSCKIASEVTCNKETKDEDNGTIL